jgi:pimeloyl-ACP methyl ester carboxylesterase
MHQKSRLLARHKTIAIFSAAVIAALAVFPIEAATAATHPRQVAADSQGITIVLEHGAWADGSSWSRVVTRLENDGYKVLVPPNPLRGLASDSAYLTDFVNSATTGPVLLVGHSYGGAVITDSSPSDPTVKGLVYVDAFAPAAGQTLGGILAASTSKLNAPPATIFDLRPFPGAAAGNVDVYLKPSTVSADFAQDLSAKEQALITAEQRPIAYSTFGETATTPGFATLPSWYVVGTEDQAIPEATQVQMAKNAGSVITYVKASHVSMISHPDVVTSVIEKAATAVMNK